MYVWVCSIRTTQLHLNAIGVQRKGIESPINDIIGAVTDELNGNGINLGAASIWKRLRRERHLLVKR